MTIPSTTKSMETGASKEISGITLTIPQDSQSLALDDSPRLVKPRRGYSPRTRKASPWATIRSPKGLKRACTASLAGAKFQAP